MLISGIDSETEGRAWMGIGAALARAARTRMGRMENVDGCILMSKRRPGVFCGRLGRCLSSRICRGYGWMMLLVAQEDIDQRCRVIGFERWSRSFWSCFDLLEKKVEW